MLVPNHNQFVHNWQSFDSFAVAIVLAAADKYMHSEVECYIVLILVEQYHLFFRYIDRNSVKPNRIDYFGCYSF